MKKTQLIVVVLALCVLVPAHTMAQQVRPGDARVQMSDVTGPHVASILLFEPGTTKTMSCAVAWGVRSTADLLASELSAGTLEPGGVNSALKVTPEAQRIVLDILNGGSAARSAGDAFAAALAPGQNGPARSEAKELRRSITGLLSTAGKLDPARPGHRAATGLTGAVYHFNQFVDASNPAFLAEPPAEFLVTEAVLSRLVVSAIENDGRVVDDKSRRGGYGLACAPPPVAALPAPPPAERAIEVCVLEDARIQFVPAVLLIDSGDTLAIRNGERVPFAEVHPDAGYAGETSWVRSGEAIVLGKDRFIPYGTWRTATPTDELISAGEYRGVPLFSSPVGGNQDLLFVPVSPHCTVQPYHRAEEVRKK